MSTTYLGPGDTLEFTAPSGGVTAGVPVLIGDTLVVPTSSVAQGLPFRGKSTGLHTVPKAGSQAWSEGVVVYWDNTAKNFTTTATANRRAGIAAAAAQSSDTTGVVKLAGIGVTAVGGNAP